MKKRINNDKIMEKMDFGLGDNAVSHNETTGLIPAHPDNEYEFHSYKNINMYQQKPITD